MKKPRSVTRKGIGGKSTKDESVKDDTVKQLSLKDEETRKVGGRDKSKGEKSVSEKSESGSGVEGKSIAEEKENEENMETPMKRKRGADGEIVRAFILSPERASSRLRPRKEVPAFRMIELSENDGEKIVGKRVKVYWSGSRKWFLGRISAFNNEKMLHNIYYDDGDKEELDLSKERFELEVLPGDNFTVKTESKSGKKVKGSDAGKIGAEGSKEDYVNEGNAELVKNHLGLKKVPTKASQRRSSESMRKDAEEKKSENLITEMDADVLADKVNTIEVQNVEEHGDADAGKDHDESKSISDKDMGTNEPPETQAMRLESNSKNKEMGSDQGEESRKTVKDKSVKGGDTEPGKRNVKLKDKVTPSVAKVRSSKLLSRKESKKEETLAEKMEVDVHHDKAETKTMHVDISLEESLDFNYPKEKDQIESLAKEANPKNGGMSHDTQASQQIFNSEKKELGSEHSKVSKENGNGGCSSPQGVKENLENLAVDVAVAVNPEEVKEKVITGDTNVEGPCDVDTVKNNDEMRSFSQAVSKETCEVSLDLQPVKPKSLEEEDPEVLQVKLKSENSESAGDMLKEELKEEGISERMMKTSTQGMEQPDDNQTGNCMNLVDLASQKNPVRRPRTKVQKR
ncbi:hypothetical protein L1049_017807 [Liquidambar formosana]|uniref:Tudor domain-containing protein n=1 Tax=Liquidambar formosana TaxID=63359 RepID=A0AAP0R820_LIQFO